jgi:hypothetical protein
MFTERKGLDIQAFVDEYATAEVKGIINNLIDGLYDSLYEHYKFFDGGNRFTVDLYEEVKLKDGKEYIISCFWSFEGVHNYEPLYPIDHYSTVKDDSINIFVDCNDEDDDSTFAIDISAEVDEWNYYHYNNERGAEPKPILQ